MIGRLPFVVLFLFRSEAFRGLTFNGGNSEQFCFAYRFERQTAEFVTACESADFIAEARVFVEAVGADTFGTGVEGVDSPVGCTGGYAAAAAPFDNLDAAG